MREESYPTQPWDWFEQVKLALGRGRSGDGRRVLQGVLNVSRPTINAYCGNPTSAAKAIRSPLELAACVADAVADAGRADLAAAGARILLREAEGYAVERTGVCPPEDMTLGEALAGLVKAQAALPSSVGLAPGYAELVVAELVAAARVYGAVYAREFTRRGPDVRFAAGEIHDSVTERLVRPRSSWWKRWLLWG